MQITFKKNRRDAEGYALTITLIFAAVMLLIFASMMNWISSNAKVTLRNNQYNMSQAAAEAATETVLGQMDRDFLSQSLTSSTYYASLSINQTNWPVQYTFSDSNGANAGSISVNLGPPATNSVALNSQFKGLYGLAQNCTLVATATPVGQPQTVSAKVTESLQFATIPLFQFAIFYNVNLEMCPGVNMIVSGPVFCNQSIWEGSETLTNASTVSAVGTNCTAAADPFANNYAPHNGTPAVNFLVAGQPTKNNDSIIMPIGTNNNPAVVRAILDLPPAAYAMGTDPAYSTNGQVYLANEADLIITNFFDGTNFPSSQVPNGTNFIVYYQNKNQSPRLLQITNDFFIITNGNLGTIFYTNHVNATLLQGKTNIYYAGFSFITNVAFYDWREGGNSGSAKLVQAVQIDLAKFNVWVTNNLANANGGYSYNYLNQNGSTSKAHPIDSIYVYNSIPLTSTTLPAVRVVNGKVLCPSQIGATRYGFTLATPFPLYVLGDYNAVDSSGSSQGLTDTTHTYPAALMADSVTILSTSWNDAITTENPSPGDTTVNAGMLEGIVQTDPTISTDYSGGVENFMRLLENWNGSAILTYNGSIVVMFYSNYATNHWSYGNYYTAPVRNWAFDTNFRQASKLPPLTPQSKTIIRGNWQAQ